MDKILIISGPTATGKTDLAIKLAKQFNGELISADSRQIYRGLDIGTGKDHPPNVKIHLIDLINPSQSFSVAQYQRLAFQIIARIHQKNMLPIIVGGTGLYIDSIVNPNKSTYSIKPNNFLRYFLNKLSTPTLQKIYRHLDHLAFDVLNNSELHNPHRLIRKIEIRLFRRLTPHHDIIASEALPSSYDILHLSLTAPTSFLYPRIDARVKKRLDIGLIDEIKKITKNYPWSCPGLNTLAYKEFKDHLVSGAPLACARERWLYNEHAYVRRQKTWFKKQKNIQLIDISKPKFLRLINEIVRKWYNKL